MMEKIKAGEITGQTGDYMLRATAANGQIRAFAATSRDLVEKARQAHNTSPVATAALGRLMTAGVMMGSMMKADRDLLTIRIEGDGPIGGLTVTADKNGNVKGNVGENLSVVRNLVIQNACCKKAFIRGAFLAAGSLSDPEKFYHFEIVCASLEKAVQLQNVILTFDIDAKIVVRKKYYVVYIKEGSQIVELLGLMEAHVALMELENIRILKEMRNSVNRQVNCETANINKTVSAAVKQLADITYIRDTVGLDYLPELLSEVAQVRLEMPDATLKELGENLSHPVGKSGVNHRLRKISAVAESLREERGE